MRLEILNGIEQPLVLPATRVVVYGDQGTPLAAVFQTNENGYSVLRVGDPQFTETLRSWGVYQTVVVQKQTVKPLDPHAFRV
jgi:hypothetical protein